MAPRVGLVCLAALLTVAACKEPGRVTEKVTEDLEVTGNHYVVCERADGSTTKDLVAYDKWVAIQIGDPC